MARIRRLFVYGTLQPQADTPMAHWIAARLVRAVPASVPGRLFAIRYGNGWFPALLPARSGMRVAGMMCELRLTPGDCAKLDRYEGPEYRRLCLPVRVGGRVSVPAQAYLWRIALPRSAVAVGRGHFLGWLQQTRSKAFSTVRNGS